ncbi:hypothetical protein MKK69_25050 [Methylobacterium sp. J-026]|uniref:hypothetical protein n=1 Tax=Methylobacterium sp. J-026 TaxID=2836624 RepID=UPI001FBA848C|nr:hypothetical protein [Methylobacterium sp. J-026]MCJ2137273.1 hypothetical protein [Methylobacterium sp. J-026]
MRGVRADRLDRPQRIDIARDRLVGEVAAKAIKRAQAELEPCGSVNPARPDTAHGRSLTFPDAGAELLAAFAIIGGGMVLPGLASLL